MSSGKNKQPLGYTILEVMIVLAISGVMFLIAATFIGSKQETTSFRVGTNGTASAIQSIIEDVIDGQYTDEPLNCVFGGGETSIQIQSSTPKAQGTNADCVFLGKILYFPSINGNNDSGYSVTPVAGLRVDALGNPVTNFSSTAAISVHTLSDSQDTPQSLNILKMTATNTTSTTPVAANGLAFLQTQGSAITQGTGTTLVSGGQSVNLYYYDSSTNPGSIDASLSTGSSALTQAANVDICVTDQTKYADIILGPNSGNNSGGQLTVSVKMDGTNTCAH
jgi:prepilin-type N-terminal cleavage/methylation domain-containing protein